MFIKIIQRYTDDIIDLDKATGIEKYIDRIIIHFPNEEYVVYSDQPEHNVIIKYFDAMLENMVYLK